mmetsp:Transcript_4508/g.7941  ORF Transcript_4508/g.7941 Transcript_4508/m.7941 type:complete len:369 (+) Transcript_4508:118-1224(+)
MAAQELLNSVSQLCEVVQKSVREDQHEGLETTEQDFASFRAILNETATKLENDTNKLVLGWKHMSDGEETQSLLMGFRKNLEVLVSCFHLVSGNAALCCEAARKQSSDAVVNLMLSVKNVASFLVQDLATEEFNIQGPPLVGAVWEACKRVRQVAKTNRAAAKRQFLNSAKVVKDVQNEFAAVLEKAQESELSAQRKESLEEEPGAEAGVPVEPEVGSDEWYALMDDLADGDDADDDDALYLESALKAITMSGRLTMAVASLLGSTDEWFTSKDIDMRVLEQAAYIKWLNSAVKQNEAVTRAVEAMGMTMYPPIDPGALAAKLNALKEQASLLSAAALDDGVRPHLDATQVESVTQIVENLSQYTLEY